MATYVFDCETDGFLDTLTVIHCLVLKNVETGEVLDFSDAKYGPGNVERGVRLLMEAECLIGHNILKFDIPAIQKIYPWFVAPAIYPDPDLSVPGLVDTFICVRLIWSDIFETDKFRVSRGTLPRWHMGAHSLEAWGYRLGCMKGEYGKDENGKSVDGVWTSWNQEMHDYCIQDVEVTHQLFLRIKSKNYSLQSIWLEHRFAEIIAMQERHGFCFDEAAAAKLYSTLVGKREGLKGKLKEAFPARWQPIATRAWKRTHQKWVADPLGAQTRVVKGQLGKTRGYYSQHVEGSEFTSIEWAEFNPSSRHHIAKRLIEKGWVPQEFTPSGDPKIDETVLEKLIYPEAELLAEHFLVEKRIAQIAEGDQAWLKLVTKGRIHGSVNTNGAVTGRCTHSKPNVAQTPKVGSPYGEECRALWTASPGKVLVGVDLEGLELRCLAHFMAHYDDGAYGRILLEGDIHWANVQALGLTDEDRDEKNKPIHKLFRNGAKTFIYAFLYGAGDEKIGSVVFDIVMAAKKAGMLADAEAVQRRFFGDAQTITADHLKAAGKKLKKSFLTKTPALKQLKDAVVARAKKDKALKGIDGRLLHIRSDHAALNTLLQSAGALIAKLATVFAYDELCSSGYIFGRDWALVAHIHDELQSEAKKELANELGSIVVDAMQRAGQFFNFRIRIDGSASEPGANWAETH